MFIISKNEAIALLSFVVTVPLCIILIIGYVIRNTSNEISDSMLKQYCIDKSNIGATEFYMKDVGNYRFVISTKDTDIARSDELYIFKSNENENTDWTYYGGLPGGSESNFNIYLTELEINQDIQSMFYIVYSDNVDSIAQVQIYPSDDIDNCSTYKVNPNEPFIIVDDYLYSSPMCCKLFDINNEEICK